MRDWILKKQTCLALLLVSWLSVGILSGQDWEPLQQSVIETGGAASVSQSGGLTDLEEPSSLRLMCESSQPQLVVTSKTHGRIEPVVICPQDDVWLISARCSHVAPTELSLLQCSRLRNGQWQESAIDELTHLHSADKSKVTFMYVHGNRTALKWAKSRGLQFYENAFQKVPRQPIRFVIFAWRSDVETLRACEDYKIKSLRSVAIGETLGRILGRFGDRELVIGGFSLGAQVVLTALANPELQQMEGCPGKYRVAIFAPALNWRYVSARLPYFPQNSLVHQTDVFLNRRDRAVRVAQTIARRRNDSEFSIEDLKQIGSSSCNQIAIHDITKQVSCRHSIVSYSRSYCLNVKLAELVNSTFADGSLLPQGCQFGDQAVHELSTDDVPAFSTARIKLVPEEPSPAK